MKHAIVGSGPVGVFLATMLSSTSEVSLVSNTDRLSSTSASELEITGACVMRPQAKNITIVRHLPRSPGLIFIATKAGQVAGIVTQLSAMTDHQVTVVICSNGLGLWSEASAMLPSNFIVVRCLCSFGVKKLSSVKVELSESPPQVTLAFLAAAQQSGTMVSDLMRRSGFTVTETNEVLKSEWEKAAMNAIINSVCTLLRAKNGILAENQNLRDLCAGLLGEIRSVALADGVDLEHLTADYFFEKLKLYARNENSTLQDLKAGRASEMPYILGRILERARQHAVLVPQLSCLAALLNAAESPLG